MNQQITDNDEDLRYAARYEHLILQERKYRERFLRLPTNQKEASIAMSALLSHRAEMINMLQSALLEAKHKDRITRSKQTQEKVEALRTLVEETWNHYMYDWGDFENNNSNTLSFASLIAWNACQENPTDIDFDIQCSIPIQNRAVQQHRPLLDAFFNDYPECIRDEYPHDKVHGEEQEAYQDILDELFNSNNRYEPSAASLYNPTHTQTSVDATAKQNTSYKAHNLGESTSSSYSSGLNNRSATFDVYHSYSNNNKHVTTHNHNPNNPYHVFKTAKEFAMDKSIQRGGNEGRCVPTHTQQQSSFDYGASDHDTWDTTPGAAAATPSHGPSSKAFTNAGGTTMDESTSNHRPALSAGLKRKFQLPKPRPANTQPDKGTYSSSGGGSSVKPTSQRPDGSSEDDSNLPEELKGLDKELISKIEMEIVDSGDPISFQDIAGLAEAKQTVMELVCWPMKRPDLFTGLRRGPNGLLLFGPPGTGKTLIGKAIAHESGATFFSISSSSLTSKWIGEGEKLVRTLFAVAGYREPSVVFIDEIDSLLTQRKADENEASRRIKTEFLVQLDGTGTSGRGRVLVVGATNRPQELDDAARRRFVKRLYIPLPEAEDRAVLLRTLLSKNVHNIADAEIERLSIDTQGFSGADLKALCTDAALGPIRQLGARALDIDAKDVPPISYFHFQQALRGMNPSVAQSDLKAYLEWNETYGSKKILI